MTDVFGVAVVLADDTVRVVATTSVAQGALDMAVLARHFSLHGPEGTHLAGCQFDPADVEFEVWPDVRTYLDQGLTTREPSQVERDAAPLLRKPQEGA
jgi:hypothetical protein